MKIKKVAVLGTGAVGSYVIWGLSALGSVELGVVAQGERAQRLKTNGCSIRKNDGLFNYTAGAEATQSN